VRTSCGRVAARAARAAAAKGAMLSVSQGRPQLLGEGRDLSAYVVGAQGLLLNF